MFIKVLPSICGVWAVLFLHCSTAKNVKHSCFPKELLSTRNVFVSWIFSDNMLPGIKAVCHNIIATWPSMMCITTAGSVCLPAIFITEEWLDSLIQQQCHITLHSE
jgi:hypothetical protein